MARTSSTKTGLSFPREQRGVTGEEIAGFQRNATVIWLQDSWVFKERKKKKKQNFSLNWKKSFGIYLEEFLSSHDWFNTTLSPWIRVICSISISSLRFWDQERKERKWRSFFKVEKEKTTCELCIHSVTLKGDVSHGSILHKEKD